MQHSYSYYDQPPLEEEGRSLAFELNAARGNSGEGLGATFGRTERGEDFYDESLFTLIDEIESEHESVRSFCPNPPPASAP